MVDVFVSYSHKDLEKVKKEIQRMISKGYNIFYDEMLNGTDSWKNLVKKEILKCDIFLLMLSENSINSRWVLWEMCVAKMANKQINTMILEDRYTNDDMDLYNYSKKLKENEFEYEKELFMMMNEFYSKTPDACCLQRNSYSQYGEDMIVASLFEKNGISKPTYMDIGANDPYKWSNTAYFYEIGCRGINIEPDPRVFEKLKRVRSEDVNLNVGVGKEKGMQFFYIMDKSSHNTFSKSQAELLQKKYGRKIVDTIQVEVCTLVDVINKYSKGVFPEFLTIDAEAYDYEILQMLAACETLPKVICVETLKYSEQYLEEKDNDIITVLENMGYKVFADTHMNTIFEKF